MRAARELPVDDIQSGDVVLRFVVALEGMKMWRGMIVPIHPNEDAEEFADGGMSVLWASLPRAFG
jgi:hypothetical protein